MNTLKTRIADLRKEFDHISHLVKLTLVQYPPEIDWGDIEGANEKLALTFSAGSGVYAHGYRFTLDDDSQEFRRIGVFCRDDESRERFQLCAREAGELVADEFTPFGISQGTISLEGPANRWVSSIVDFGLVSKGLRLRYVAETRISERECFHFLPRRTKRETAKARKLLKDKTNRERIRQEFSDLKRMGRYVEIRDGVRLSKLLIDALVEGKVTNTSDRELPVGFLTIGQICKWFGRNSRPRSRDYDSLRYKLKTKERSYRKDTGRNAYDTIDWVDKSRRAHKYDCDNRNVKDVLSDW